MSRILKKTPNRLSFISDGNISKLVLKNGVIGLYVEVSRKFVLIRVFDEKQYNFNDLEVIFRNLSSN